MTAAREAQRALEASLQAQMEGVNAQPDPHERVHFIAIADGPWTVANGLMTPTLKIKRNALESRYQAFVESWERQNVPVVWESAPSGAGANSAGLNVERPCRQRYHDGMIPDPLSRRERLLAAQGLGGVNTSCAQGGYEGSGRGSEHQYSRGCQKGGRIAGADSE